MNHPTLLKEEEKKKSVLELAQVRSSLVFKTEENLQRAMVPFPEAAYEELIYKQMLGKDCTEATSAKPARLASLILWSGRGGIDNEYSSVWKEGTE